MKLETLTDEQWSHVYAKRERVIAETVAPGPADRGRVEAGIVACYAHLGLGAPRVVWVDGPLSAVIAANLLKQGGQLWGQLWDQLGETSFEAWWLYWAHHWQTVNQFVPNKMTDDQSALLQAWIDAHSASVWVPYANVAIVADRHTRLTRDAEGRLHSEDGLPAWEWADGTAVYAHHGRRVEPWVVSGKTGAEQIEKIAAETNIEVRRCAIERYGWGEYVVDAGWEPVASDEFGDLFDVPGEEDQRVCVVVNGTVERDGTRRRYGLLCRSHHRSPLEAVAASYGVAPDLYRSLERRT